MTQMGEITVLDNHAPLITAIKPSTMYIIYKDENGVDFRDDFAVGSGVVEVSNSEVKVMSDMLVDIEDLDVDNAERAKKEALELMEQFKDAKDRVDMEKFIEAEDMLLRSIAQLKLYDLKK
jgi:ATP synthase F1 epsilon subunit